MAKKLIKTNGKGDAQELGKVQSYKAKPKPYREPDSLREYRLERERFFWKKYPEQRAEIEEKVKQMKMYLQERHCGSNLIPNFYM